MTISAAAPASPGARRVARRQDSLRAGLDKHLLRALPWQSGTGCPDGVDRAACQTGATGKIVVKNLDIYFTGPLNFIFKADLETEDDRQSMADYIRERHSVLCIGIGASNNRYAVSFGPSDESFGTYSCIDLVEILEEKVIGGENMPRMKVKWLS